VVKAGVGVARPAPVYVLEEAPILVPVHLPALIAAAGKRLASWKFSSSRATCPTGKPEHARGIPPMTMASSADLRRQLIRCRDVALNEPVGNSGRRAAQLPAEASRTPLAAAIIVVDAHTAKPPAPLPAVSSVQPVVY